MKLTFLSTLLVASTFAQKGSARDREASDALYSQESTMLMNAMYNSNLDVLLPSFGGQPLGYYSVSENSDGNKVYTIGAEIAGDRMLRYDIKVTEIQSRIVLDLPVSYETDTVPQPSTRPQDSNVKRPVLFALNAILEQLEEVKKAREIGNSILHAFITRGDRLATPVNEHQEVKVSFILASTGPWAHNQESGQFIVRYNPVAEKWSSKLIHR